MWLFMYARRIAFTRGNKLQPAQLAIPGELARLSPAAVSNPSDNLKNHFEIPVLFYAVSLSTAALWFCVVRAALDHFAR